jgi:hypothetical protein
MFVTVLKPSYTNYIAIYLLIKLIFCSQITLILLLHAEFFFFGNFIISRFILNTVFFTREKNSENSKFSGKKKKKKKLSGTIPLDQLLEVLPY